MFDFFTKIIGFLDKVFKIPEPIKKWIKPKMWFLFPIVFGIGLVAAFFCGRKCWDENHWYFDLKKEVLSTDLLLKSGKATVMPQIVIEYQDVIVYVLDLVNFYNINEADIRTDADGKNAHFSLEIEESQKDKLNDTKEAFRDLLESKIGEEKIKACEIYDIRLVHVEYFEYNRFNKSEQRNLCCSESETRVIQDGEVEIHRREKNFDLDSFNTRSSLISNAELFEYVNECADQIEKA